MITREEILMGRDTEYPLSPELETNLMRLLVALNKFRQIYGKPMHVTSGYRPGIYNKKAGGSIRSAHLTLEACDFADADGSLANFCVQNLKLLVECGLWLESPLRTKGWVHLQIRSIPGVRIFEP